MKLNLFYLLAFTFVFTACQKESLDQSDDSTLSDMTLRTIILGRDGEDEEEYDDEFCLDLVLPYSVLMPDGSTITLNTEEDWLSIMNWYESNPDAEEEPNLIYPVTVIFEGDEEDNETIIVNSEEALKELLEACEEEWEEDHEDCFEFVFPFSVQMPDGSTITLNGEEDWALIETWYESNPDTEEEPSINYPIEIDFKEGEIITVNNAEELEEIEKACEEEWEGDKDDCFELLLPLNINLPDGTSFTINEEEDWNAVKEWYESNPDTEEELSLEYPVEVKLEDGEVLTINNEEEMEALKEDCD